MSVLAGLNVDEIYICQVDVSTITGVYYVIRSISKLSNKTVFHAKSSSTECHINKSIIVTKTSV